MGIYKHPLPGRNIRLLRISPGELCDPISVSLSYASLDNAPPYEALSYVWGDASITEPITCNGIAMNITTNLAHALRRIRQGVAETEVGRPSSETAASQLDKRRELRIWSFRDVFKNLKYSASTKETHGLYWIDALCINQQDTAERNHQVLLMSEVYSLADKVLVWLGDAAIPLEDEVAASRILDVLNQHCRATMTSWDDPGVMTLEELSQSMHQQGIPGIWRPLRLLFSSQRFKRSWCVQEFVHAQQLLVVCRSLDIPGDDIRTFAAWFVSRMKQSTERLRSLPQGNREIISVCTSGALSFGIYDRNMHPVDVLTKCAGLQATDPRDRFFSIQGIIKPGYFKSDYSQSVRDVYIDATIRMLQSDLRVLSRVSHDEHGGVFNHYPSWVSAWDKDTVSASLTYSPPCEDIYHAGLRRKVAVDENLARSGLLRLRGVSCGILVDTTRLAFNSFRKGTYGENTQVIQQSLRKMWKCTHGHTSWTSSTTVELALTLTGGFLGNHTRRMTGFGHVQQPGSQVQQHFMLNLLAFARFMLPVSQSVPDESTSSSGDRLAFEEDMSYVDEKSQILHTNRDWLCLGPLCAKPADHIVVFDNGPIPYILRPINDGSGRFAFMGW